MEKFNLKSDFLMTLASVALVAMLVLPVTKAVGPSSFEFPQTPNEYLVEAVKTNSFGLASLALKNGATNVNEALLVAAESYNDRGDMIEFLLDRGANSETRRDTGCECPYHEATSLWIASYCGETSVVKALLEHGADVDATNVWQETPLMCAGERGPTGSRRKIVSLLLEHDARVKLESKYGLTALMKIVDCIRFDDDDDLIAVGMLLYYGANVNATTPGGLSALSYAVNNRTVRVARLLLRYGANINVRSTDGGTLLQQAEENKDEEMVALLRRYGAR